MSALFTRGYPWSPVLWSLVLSGKGGYPWSLVPSPFLGVPSLACSWGVPQSYLVPLNSTRIPTSGQATPRVVPFVWSRRRSFLFSYLFHFVAVAGFLRAIILWKFKYVDENEDMKDWSEGYSYWLAVGATAVFGITIILKISIAVALCFDKLAFAADE